MSRSLKGKKPLLDTNVFIERPVADVTLQWMLLSSVVLYELIAANIDDKRLRVYISWAKFHRTRGTLLTPNDMDWLESSKLVRNLLRGTRSGTIGYVKKVTSAQQQQNDALIARAAWTHNCFVVTSNERDFNKFKPYMKGLDIVPADHFFDD